jgi:KaiC/GvpD/RAD55 family RecA-like ATPase
LLNEYNFDTQTFFLQMMVTNAELYIRVANIINSENFDRRLRPVVDFIIDHTTKHSIMPDTTQIKATTGISIDKLEDQLGEGHYSWFLEEFEEFTKRQELERAIVKCYDLLEKKKEWPTIWKLFKEAYEISLTKDMGTDYFADPKARLERYFNNGGQVSTGWPQLDHIMYGGFSRGELNIFAGGSGSGKSLVMMNMALNWLQMGLSGVYISLELSEDLTSLRTDAMATGMSTKDIRKNIDTVELKIKMAGKKLGQYRVKGLPAQSNVNDIRAYLKEVQIQTGLKIDFVMIDYLDLVMPVGVKVNPNDQFIKDKYVSEELRNLARELSVLMVTASQLNRGAVDEVEFDHSHIAGGISKINTADNVFGIFTSRSMRERGKYQIQCMKSRSSTGVGQKIDLDYDVPSMRITDSGGDDSNKVQPAGNQLLNQIKATSRVASDTEKVDPITGEIEPDQNKIVADVQSTKLKSLLASLKK